MSQVLGEIDGEAPLDVPTMMKILMVVYNSVRDDDVMEDVAEAVGDAICLLGDMRTLAQQVAAEDAVSGTQVLDEFDRILSQADPSKIC